MATTTESLMSVEETFIFNRALLADRMCQKEIYLSERILVFLMFSTYRAVLFFKALAKGSTECVRPGSIPSIVMNLIVLVRVSLDRITPKFFMSSSIQPEKSTVVIYLFLVSMNDRILASTLVMRDSLILRTLTKQRAFSMG
jgi:hypothetical protein